MNKVLGVLGYKSSSAVDETGNAHERTMNKESGEAQTPVRSQSAHLGLRSHSPSAHQSSTEPPPRKRGEGIAKRMRQFAARKFHSGQVSMLGVHTVSQSGIAVSLPTQGNVRVELPPAQTPPGPEQVPLPESQAKFSFSRQSLIHSAIHSTFGSRAKTVRKGPKIEPEKELFHHAICAAMVSEAASRDYISKCFGVESSSPSLDALHAELMADGAGAGVSGARPFEQAVLLAEALHGAVGADISRASNALKQLKSGAFLLAEEVPDASAHTTQAKRDALQVARLLVDTGVGMDTLLASFSETLPEALHEPLQCAIQACEQLEKENPALKAVDFSRFVDHAKTVAGSLSDTLACKVLRAESKQIASGIDLRDSTSRSDKAAIFSWRQGFREEGAGSLLYKTQHRLAKFRKYVGLSEQQFARSAPQPEQNVFAATKSGFDHAMHAAGDHLQRSVGKKKNPLRALAKYGALSADLQHPYKDQPLLDGHLTTAMHELMNHLAGQMPEAAATSIRARPSIRLREYLQHDLAEEASTRSLAGNAWSPRLAAASNAALRHLRGASDSAHARMLDIPPEQLKLAVLAQWAVKSQRARPEGVSLESTDIQAIHRRLHAASGADTVCPQKIPDAIKRLQGMSLSHALLAQWGAESGIGMYGESGASGESRFAKSMRRARNILHPDKNVPENSGSEAMRKFLKDFVVEHNGGNTMTFSDGSSFGLNMASISINVALAVSKIIGMATTPVADVRANRTRSAVFNIGTSSAIGGEIFLGRQNQTTAQIGGGAIAAFSTPGLPFYHPASASASVVANATLLGLERANPVGVRMRFVAKRNAEGKLDYAAVRQQMVNMVDYMFDACTAEKAHLKPEELWEDFANQHFEAKNLSISWQDYVTQATKMGAGVSVGAKAGVKLKPKVALKVGASLGYAVNATISSKTRRTEKSGSHPVVRQDHGKSHEQILSIGVSATVPFSELPGSRHTQANSLGNALPVASGYFLLENGGFTATFRSILDHGRFSESFTFRDVSERNVKDFIALANEPGRREQWEQLCTAAEGGDPARGKARLDVYISRLRSMARPHQAYYMRRRVRAEVLSQVDVLWQSYNVARKSGQTEVMAERSAQIAALLSDESAWVPNALFVMHNKSKQSTTGLNFGLQANVQVSAASERELEFIGLPIAIADAWTQVTRS